MVAAESLRKTYDSGKRGKFEAVRGISFAAHGGEIFGLLGPNGAGKTTTLRMLATILSPSGGTARINGFDLATDPGNVRKSIGFLSNDTGLYQRLSGREMIEYAGHLHGLDNSKLARNLESIRSLIDLDGFIEQRCGKMSSGQKQRVSIVRAVIHDPPVLILDEPTSGLDVLASRTIVEFIRRARSQGKCVILSTHIMGEAERLCDRIAIIHEGLIKAAGSLPELAAQFEAADLETIFLKAVGAV